MSAAQPSPTSPAKWALVGGLSLGFVSALNGFQMGGEMGFAIGYAMGPAALGAVGGWAAAHIKRMMSKP